MPTQGHKLTERPSPPPNAPAHPLAHRQAGFIITLEFILVTTILVIGTFVGVVAVRDALIKYKVSQESKEIVVSDSNGRPMGKYVGFDEHEAPLLFYIDRTLTPPAGQAQKNYRALIGVRDDRFTSREPIYYITNDCSGPPCIKAPSSESVDNRGVDQLPATGAVGYLYGLQGAPTYAVGRGNGLPGFLYRQTPEACPLGDLVAGVGGSVNVSRYISQKVVSGEPCEYPHVLGIPEPTPPLFCPINIDVGGVITPTCNSPCLSESGGAELVCSCPVDYTTVLPGVCCPPGSEYEADLFNPTCSSSSGLFIAESVPDVNDETQNALEDFQPPFSVNLPTGSADGDDWQYTLPGKEGEGY